MSIKSQNIRLDTFSLSTIYGDDNNDVRRLSLLYTLFTKSINYSRLSDVGTNDFGLGKRENIWKSVPIAPDAGAE